ncbi:osmc family protein [Anaeramoeba ignava]|uniref:Osmc family protein n=1 Tax=Anaeramoeba ignava TaxID=1746090 RepID=A0A9Q0R944_ANAIG|nr:osmc family protein [Anaeramoeba ignava]
MLSAISAKPTKSFSSLFLRSASKLFPIKVSGVSQPKEPLHTKLQLADFKIDIDEIKKLGGDNTGPNPLYVVLSSLAGCEMILLRLVAKEKKVKIGEVQVEVDGGIDLKGLYGDPNVYPGYQTIDVRFKLESEADDKTLHEVMEAARQRCPVASMLGTHPKIKFTNEWERLKKSKF